MCIIFVLQHNFSAPVNIYSYRILGWVSFSLQWRWKKEENHTQMLSFHFNKFSLRFPRAQWEIFAPTINHGSQLYLIWFYDEFGFVFLFYLFYYFHLFLLLKYYFYFDLQTFQPKKGRQAMIWNEFMISIKIGDIWNKNNCF